MNCITSPAIDSAPTVRAPMQWLNIKSLLPEPLPPPRDPDDGRPSRVEALQHLRLRALTEQDASDAPWIDIPAPVLKRYREIGRPTPLMRARGLEQALGTRTRIWLKREDLLPTGAFKLNSAIAQAYYAAAEGATHLVTETGAGQWGVAVAYAARMFGLSCRVFWVRLSERQKRQRSALARMMGADIIPSPSSQTAVGRSVLERDPQSMGALGTAIGEAICYAQDHPAYRYISGSNLPHVLLHQTIIGLETKRQLAALAETPDTLCACVGGGSNLVGFIGPFLEDKLADPEGLRLVAAESAAAPRLTQGVWRYDHADPEGVTPLTLSYTLGRDCILPASHVGGLRQHSGSTMVGLMHRHGLLDARVYDEQRVFDVGRLVLRTEGFLPAPESCHALAGAIDIAQRGESKSLIVCVSGSGLLDLESYIDVLGL